MVNSQEEYFKCNRNRPHTHDMKTSTKLRYNEFWEAVPHGEASARCLTEEQESIACHVFIHEYKFSMLADLRIAPLPFVKLREDIKKVHMTEQHQGLPPPPLLVKPASLKACSKMLLLVNSDMSP